ncbi:MAG: hypothetical protein J0I24_01610 [Thiomonas arsenitoxydans]|uniref:Uncharacterized protein n=1 Tax=Thiomonas arsenitoxydans (strain DSM 22701 / CIP 110005 / 3As) TaxID=426114 RepID=A0A8I1MV74_THIA3|nr:hypothetical protein [Thiomonas arsenitoxydans]MBN8742984.1 hypothetical protein [Thiomonas arsenitoxydans]
MKTNLQRLQTHLKSDSLAHKLVSAAIAPEPTADLAAVLKEALESRAQEIRSKFNDGKV